MYAFFEDEFKSKALYLDMQNCDVLLCKGRDPINTPHNIRSMQKLFLQNTRNPYNIGSMQKLY